MNKPVKFLDLNISRLEMDEIEAKALSLIKQRAHQIYINGPDHSTASAWVLAVLEYLHNLNKETK